MKANQILRLLEGVKETSLQEKTNSILKTHFSNIKSYIHNFNMGFITGYECITMINDTVEKTLGRIYKIQMVEIKNENQDHLDEIIFLND